MGAEPGAEPGAKSEAEVSALPSATATATATTTTTAAQLRLIADQAPLMMALFEGAGEQCLYANARFANTFGLDARGLPGRRFLEIFGQLGMPQAQTQLKRLEAERKPLAEAWLLDAQGQGQGQGHEPRWIEVELIPNLDEKGRFLSILLSARDISGSRKTEQRLHASELRLEQFMHAVGEGLIVHRRGTITDVNPSLCALIGYRREELLGR